MKIITWLFHAGPKLLGTKISRGPNFLGPKIQISQAPKKLGVQMRSGTISVTCRDRFLSFGLWHKYLGSVEESTLPVPYWPQFKKFDVPRRKIRLYWLQITYFYHLERQILKIKAIWMLKNLNILFYDFLSFSVFHDV